MFPGYKRILVMDHVACDSPDDRWFESSNHAHLSVLSIIGCVTRNKIVAETHDVCVNQGA